MISAAAMLYALLLAAFCVGAAVFYGVGLRRTPRQAGLGWAVCAALVLGLSWAAVLLDLAPRALVFTGLFLPVWLVGGLCGLVFGMLLQRKGRR